MNNPALYINTQTPIAARQGAGMCQLSENEIMIVGGFNGKFLSDYIIPEVDTNTKNVDPKQINMFNRPNTQMTLFPF